MDRAPKIKPLTGYYERHRIIPGCMGGKYVSGNIAWLTPEEHYIAHQLLVKIYPNDKKLLTAALGMTVDYYGKRSNNKLHGWLKRKQASLMSIDNPMSYVENRIKISKAKKGVTPKNFDYVAHANKLRDKPNPKVSEFLKQTSWWNNGSISVRSAEKPEGDWSRGRIPFPRKPSLTRSESIKRYYQKLRSSP